jgi:glycine cleavage system H protein
MSIPTDCRYSKSHEWAKPDGELFVIGITDFAQHELGDVVFVELPPTGSKFKLEETFGVIESVKAASDLFLPMGGEVVAINEALNADPALVNKDPHGEAWLLKIKPSKPAEYDAMLDAKGYGEFIASEAKH